MKISINKILTPKIIVFIFSILILIFLSYLNFSFNKNINRDVKSIYNINEGRSISFTVNELYNEK